MELIHKYFKQINDKQIDRFSQLGDLYRYWNERINVISRKDIDALYEHHVLHSLSIAQVIDFKANTAILDIGTGGGFPGIPLAILFPQVHFHLIDSIKKKVKVVQEVTQALSLKNVTYQAIRSNELKRKFDFVLSRAVTNFPKFAELAFQNLHQKDKNSLPNGILYLKGGDFSKEIKPFKKHVSIFEISDFFEEEFFKTKKIIYLPNI